MFYISLEGKNFNLHLLITVLLVSHFTVGIVSSRSLLKLFLFLFNFHQILFSEETKSREDEKTLGHSVNAGVAIDLGGLDVDVNVGGVL